MDVTFILTEDCNLRCTYCYQKHFRRNELPPELGVEAVKSAIAAGEDSLALTYFGGEPLLRAGAMLEIQHAARALCRSAGVAMTAKVPTNGLLLDADLVRRAGEAGVFISLSFDGVPAAQDAGRVRPDGTGSFADAERALRLLVAARRPFGVYSVITPANVAHLAESRRFLWDAGARILVSAIDYTAPWDERGVRTLVEQYEKVGRWYGELLKRREHFHLEPLDSRIAQRTRRRDWRRCHPGISQVTVAPDGTLYGCVEFFYRRLYPLGTASTWLEREKVRAFAAQHLAGRPEECKSCGVADRCTHSCACVNLRTTGRANVPPESVCHTEQATIRAVDGVAAELYRRRVPEFLMRHYSNSYHLLSGIEKLLQDYGVDDEQQLAEAPVADGATDDAGHGAGHRAGHDADSRPVEACAGGL